MQFIKWRRAEKTEYDCEDGCYELVLNVNVPFYPKRL